MSYGQRLAELGIEQAQDHAQAAIPNWTARILDCLERWVRLQEQPFAIEDFRAYVRVHHPDLMPPSPNAWGAVGRIAARRNIIKPTGYRPAQSTRTHAHPVRVFERAV